MSAPGSFAVAMMSRSRKVSLRLLGAPVQRQLGDGARGFADAGRRLPVRKDAERRFTFQLEQVGEQVELIRDVDVARKGARHLVEYTHVPSAVVCLPTYNERENLEPMLRALGDKGVRVLVVDDNSPDGTGEIADRLAGELDYVDVLHRELKEGLGPAYLAGFRRALADGAELVLEMDCDFSHDPADVPRLLDAASDADLVLASRYVKGGGTAN